MRKTVFITVMIFMAIAASAQEKETRKVDNFSGISLGVAGELYLTQGQGYSVVLEGDRDLLEDIETFERNGVLVIRKDNWMSSTNKRVKVYVTMPEVESLNVSGSGHIIAQGAVKSDEMELNVSGSGKLILENLTAEELDCSISGSGNISLEGMGAKECDLSISGSGRYDGTGLEVGEMVVSISGSGNCRCNVVKDLEARVSGSGDVYYTGNPNIDARVSGSGKVRKL
jgi:hypothetical protein